MKTGVKQNKTIINGWLHSKISPLRLRANSGAATKTRRSVADGYSSLLAVCSGFLSLTCGNRSMNYKATKVLDKPQDSSPNVLRSQWHACKTKVFRALKLTAGNRGARSVWHQLGLQASVR